MSIPILDAKDEKKFHIRLIVEHFEKPISENEGRAASTAAMPKHVGVALAADALVVGLIAFPREGGMGQTVTIEGLRDGKPANASDLFSFWLNLSMQLSKHRELDEVRRELAAECARKVYAYLSKAVDQAAPKTIIKKA